MNKRRLFNPRCVALVQGDHPNQQVPCGRGATRFFERRVGSSVVVVCLCQKHAPPGPAK